MIIVVFKNMVPLLMLFVHVYMISYVCSCNCITITSKSNKVITSNYIFFGYSSKKISLFFLPGSLKQFSGNKAQFGSTCAVYSRIGLKSEFSKFSKLPK